MLKCLWNRITISIQQQIHEGYSTFCRFFPNFLNSCYECGVQRCFELLNLSRGHLISKQNFRAIASPKRRTKCWVVSAFCSFFRRSYKSAFRFFFWEITARQLFRDLLTFSKFFQAILDSNSSHSEYLLLVLRLYLHNVFKSVEYSWVGYFCASRLVYNFVKLYQYKKNNESLNKLKNFRLIVLSRLVVRTIVYIPWDCLKEYYILM